MVEHCHLEFTENPHQQYPKPPFKINSDEAAIIDVEIQQLLEKGVLEETAPTNLVPRSHSVTGNVRSGKVRFRACSVPARPEIRAFLSLRMFVLSVVILGDFAE